MKRMKLCIMATASASIVSFYGEQLDYLKERGFDVTVITSPDNNLAKKISSSSKLFFIPMSRQITPLKDIISFFKVAKVFRRERFDMVQYNSPKAAILGSICGYFFHVPVRLYLMWGIYYSAQKGFRRKLFKAVEKIICILSTHVSPDSKGNRTFAIDEKLCPQSKLSVVGYGSANGVNLDRFNPYKLKVTGIAIRKALNLPEGAIVVGFVGRLKREKGINELIEAFVILAKKYPKLYLLLVGPREDRVGEYKKSVCKILADEKRIISVGFKENPQEYMAAMDIFVLPSYREGFGIVNIEASAMELPIISTDIPGPRDSIINNKTGMLVAVRNEFQLQEAIEKLYSDQIGRAHV